MKSRAQTQLRFTPEPPDENGKYLPNGQSAKSGLTKSILDNGWGQFVDILIHKAANAGVSVVKVNPNNTSQICSCCNAHVPKDLSVRVHECACGYIADRDVNAAINIKKVGLGVFLTQKRSSGATRTLKPTPNQ